MGGGVVTVSEISKKIFQQKGGAVKKKLDAAFCSKTAAK
jgi:hypothetical protein